MKRNRRMSTEEGENKDGESVIILDVRIDSTTVSKVLEQVRKTIRKRAKIVIVTPNPEIVLAAYHDLDLKKALNTSNIALPDGVGLIRAERYIKGNRGIFQFVRVMWGLGDRGEEDVLQLINYPAPRASGIPKEKFATRSTSAQKRRVLGLRVIKGREMFEKLIEEGNRNSWKVVLLGSKDGSAEKAARRLKIKWPNVKLYPIEGPNLTLDAEPVRVDDKRQEKAAIDLIKKIKPELVFVGFGAPRQEKWIYKWKDKLNANVFMVVGGTFDYISQKASVPPAFWPNELEWLWRLVTQLRFKRVWNAVFTFPWVLFTQERR